MGVDDETEGEETNLHGCLHLLWLVDVTNHSADLTKSEDLGELANFENQTCHMVEFFYAKDVYADLSERQCGNDIYKEIRLKVTLGY